MSEFMLIAPTGWTALDYEFVVNNVLDQNTMENLILQGQIYEIENALRVADVITSEQSIQEIKFIDSAYMWVRLG